MRTLGNIIWFIFGGWANGLAWFFAGIVCCITVIGIPFAGQFVKIAKLWLMPFGAEIEQ